MQKEVNFSWVMRIIYSSTNSFHVECCRILCDRFKALYDDDELHQQLISAMHNQEAKWSVTV